MSRFKGTENTSNHELCAEILSISFNGSDVPCDSIFDWLLAGDEDSEES